MFGEGDGNGGDSVEVCDAEFLSVLEQEEKVEFGHDVDGDTAMESASDEKGLAVSVVQWQEAGPTGAGGALFVVGVKSGHVGDLKSV